MIKEANVIKFSISRPPTEGKDLSEKHDRLASWLYTLAEELELVLSNLGEENFSKGALEALFGKKEENNGDL